MLDPDAWKDHSLGTEAFSALQLLIARLQQYGMLSEGLSKADLKNISSELDAKRNPGNGSPKEKSSPSASSQPTPSHTKQQASGEHKNMTTPSTLTLPDSRSSSPATGHLKGSDKLSPPPSPVHRALTVLARVGDKGGGGSTSSSGGPSPAHTGDFVDDEEELKKAMTVLEAEAEYKGMLNAMIIDKLTPAKIANLEEFRRKHGITAEQHAKVLKTLNMTVQQFAEMKRGAEKNETNTQAENDRECIICMTRRREIAFVACGHVATCVECTKGLTVCPVCRTPVTTTMRIFT